MAPPRDDFAAVRPVRRLNRLTQALLAVALALAANHLASLPEFRVREDVTPDRRHSLAAETTATLRAAGTLARAAKDDGQPWVRALLLTNSAQPTDARRARLARLLEAYEAEAARDGRPWFAKQDIGDSVNATLYSAIAARHGAPEAGTALILVRGTRAKYLSYAELFPRNADQAEFFRGEEAVTGALLEITEEKAAVCYVTQGHGELGVDDPAPLRGLSLLSRQLRNRNFEVRALDLATAGEVPRDAALVLVAGPRASFTATEDERLRSYLGQRNGRVLLLLDPGQRHGLDNLLAEWAIFSPDAELQEPDPGCRTVQGDIALRSFFEGHPLTKPLAALPLLATRLRPVRFDLGSSPDSTLSVRELVRSSAAAWGESDPAQRPARFDPERDHPGPVYVAAAATRTTGIRKGEGSGGRLIVVGSSELAANARLERGGNAAFLTQCAAWLGDRERAVAVPVRAGGLYRLNATADDLWTLALRFALIPLLVLSVGLAVSFWRRRS
ncbi:hypothetical protein EBR16_04690 [bacterium]|jgi:ABC-type uncharacterized transport system|nr:hypothetical protein [bacterium]